LLSVRSITPRRTVASSPLVSDYRVSESLPTSLRSCSGPQEGRRAAHLCALDTGTCEYTRIGHLVRGRTKLWSRLRLICNGRTTESTGGRRPGHNGSLRRFVRRTPIAVRYGARYRRVRLSQPVFTQSAYKRSTGNGRHWRLFCRNDLGLTGHD
jgi:hypothetical protein